MAGSLDGFRWTVMERLTIEELQRRRQHLLSCTAEAVSKKRAAFQELKKLIHGVNSGPLDVSEYYLTASRLGRLLDEIDGGGQTIFGHFRNQIDPRKGGTAVHFRFECRDLAAQIADLETWRAQRRGLRILK